MYDPLYKHGPHPIAEPNLPPPSPQAPLANPSPFLLAGLEPRPLSPSGYPINDKAIPQQFLDWKAEYENQGGFWGKVANYYVKKHEASASIYRSPFTPKIDASSNKVAEAYYQALGSENRLKIDDFKVNGMRS